MTMDGRLTFWALLSLHTLAAATGPTCSACYGAPYTTTCYRSLNREYCCCNMQGVECNFDSCIVDDCKWMCDLSSPPPPPPPPSPPPPSKSCASPPRPPLAPSQPLTHPTMQIPVLRVQDASWFTNLANSDVADAGGMSCYIERHFDEYDLPNPVLAQYTIEAFEPVLNDDASYANCPDVRDHTPITPPRKCVGGHATKVGATHCSPAANATCTCEQPGTWYSLPLNGECDPSGVPGADCFWRVLTIDAVVPFGCLRQNGCGVHDCGKSTLLSAFNACKAAGSLCTPRCDKCNVTAHGASACNAIGRLAFDGSACTACLERTHGQYGWFATPSSAAFASAGSSAATLAGSLSWSCDPVPSPGPSPPFDAPATYISNGVAPWQNASGACTCHYGD